MIDLGWAHPSILQALAEINGIELRIWKLGENGKLIPHDVKEYSVYKPKKMTKERCDILFVNANHFDKLILSEYKDGVDYYPQNKQSKNNAHKRKLDDTYSEVLQKKRK
jgi:hypothetical protein